CAARAAFSIAWAWRRDPLPGRMTIPALFRLAGAFPVCPAPRLPVPPSPAGTYLKDRPGRWGIALCDIYRDPPSPTIKAGGVQTHVQDARSARSPHRLGRSLGPGRFRRGGVLLEDRQPSRAEPT